MKRIVTAFSVVILALAVFVGYDYTISSKSSANTSDGKLGDIVSTDRGTFGRLENSPFLDGNVNWGITEQDFLKVYPSAKMEKLACMNDAPAFVISTEFFGAQRPLHYIINGNEGLSQCIYIEKLPAYTDAAAIITQIEAELGAIPVWDAHIEGEDITFAKAETDFEAFSKQADGMAAGTWVHLEGTWLTMHGEFKAVLSQNKYGGSEKAILSVSHFSPAETIAAEDPIRTNSTAKTGVSPLFDDYVTFGMSIDNVVLALPTPGAGISSADEPSRSSAIVFAGADCEAHYLFKTEDINATLYKCVYNFFDFRRIETVFEALVAELGEPEYCEYNDKPATIADIRAALPETGGYIPWMEIKWQHGETTIEFLRNGSYSYQVIQSCK